MFCRQRLFLQSGCVLNLVHACPCLAEEIFAAVRRLSAFSFEALDESSVLVIPVSGLPRGAVTNHTHHTSHITHHFNSRRHQLFSDQKRESV